MADVEAIEAKLKEIEAIEGVGDAVLVSRGGTFIAGSLPPTADTDTYAAMVATLAGSADTVVHEVEETLRAILLTMEKSRVLVIQDGPKALYALRIHLTGDVETILARVDEINPEIEALL
jgi:predicted regulator of Ras-like GTPase activity (Roadblock/LC7/MglB family)